MATLRKQADVKHALARLFEPLLRFLNTGSRARDRQEWGTAPYTFPYSCDYVGGPTVYRTGERPPRGEDSPLVRPYLIAHERHLAEKAARAAAEERRQRARRRTLWLAVHGVDVGPRRIHGIEVAA
ncbi:hypothetical protein [Streptomyces sp. NPDC018352]|uniref:hypothetical protein n=1 Tax=Streptomyces sp. NPDC018352 TaxID=3157194 RepID=UPI0033D9E139